jgi:hypothetical protein
MFDSTLKNIQKIYPNVNVQYKNESSLMKFIGKFMFFNPAFMTGYTTTIGNTIYYTNREFVEQHPDAATIVLLHELVHINDSNNKNLLFNFLYLIPQVFSMLFIPFIFFIGWKALFFLLFLTPIPAYWRMINERRAYTISIYVSKKLNDIGYHLDLFEEASFYASQFKNSSYYFMFPFKSIDSYFQTIALQIQAGDKPELEKNVYDLVDKVFSAE